MTTNNQPASFDLHPDDLIDRARQGRLTGADRRRLDDHLAECSACALEVAAVDDFESEAAAHVDDSAAATIAARALAALDAAPAPLDVDDDHESSRRRAPLLARLAAVAGLVLALGVGAAAAAYWTGLIGDDEPATNTRVKRHRAPAPPAVPPEPERVAPEIETPPAPIETPSVRRDPRAPEPVPAVPTAAELLARANAARRDGRYRDAADLYRALQRQYPKSREQQVSRIAAGRLFLTRLDDPAAALAQFEAYVKWDSDGTLAEEARVGRAQALRRLGRRSAERKAWKNLLKHHSTSPHAERARKRLDELDGEQ